MQPVSRPSSGPQMRRAIALLWATCGALWGAGCATAASGAFNTSYPENRREDMAAVLTQLAQSTDGDARPVAVGTCDSGDQVFAYDLRAARLLWTVSALPKSPPVIAGDYVILHEPGILRVLRLSDGSVLDERADERRTFIGAAGEGDLAAIVLSSAGGTGSSSQLLVLRDGKVSHEQSISHRLGAPAVTGGLIFVPWDNVHLSALSADGREKLRLRVSDDLLTRAFTHRGDVYFGQLSLYRLSADFADGQKAERVHYRPSLGGLPGDLSFMPPSNREAPSVDSARHRVKVSFVPALHGERLGLAHDQLYLLFYRHVFALDPNETGVHWAYAHAGEVVGMNATEDGVLLADASGSIVLLDSKGRTRLRLETGIRPAIVHFRAANFRPSLKNAPAAAPLSEQLAAIASDGDARLVPTRTLAIESLAELPGEPPTAQLIDLCGLESLTERVREAACAALAQRKAGERAVLSALEQHGDFLAGTRPAALGPLAAAAANMQAQSAVPLLLEHLKDPNTPAQALPELMAALKTLAGPACVGAVHDFLMLYHAEDEDPDLVEALQIGMELLADQAGTDAAPTLTLIAKDALAPTKIRDHATKVLRTLRPRHSPNEANKSEPRVSGAEIDRSGEAAAGGATSEAEPVEQLLQPIMEALRVCLRQGRSLSARLKIVVNGEGKVVLVRTLPIDLVGCMAPLVAGLSFPSMPNGGRRQMHYTVRK